MKSLKGYRIGIACSVGVMRHQDVYYEPSTAFMDFASLSNGVHLRQSHAWTKSATITYE